MQKSIRVVEEVGDNLQLGTIISSKQAYLAGLGQSLSDGILNLQFRINYLFISLAQ